MLISKKKARNIMIRDNYIDIDKIITDKKVLRLFRTVEKHGGVLRFVGGCVRDTIRGIKGFDLDLATDLSPEELVEACDENSLKTVPIGIKFGTVGVVIDNNVLEVTSLRRDIKTDGRRAEVEFTSDWEVDASRRDLTINAVYADEKGNVFDYYNGIDDLEKGIVRFIGNPSMRIKEDYLRILRFFRFYSIFGKGPIDEKAVKACIENSDGLKLLSMERIRDELIKILLTDNVVPTLKLMFSRDVLSNILPDPKYLDNLEFLIKLVDKEALPHEAMRRLFVIYQPDEALAENLAVRLKMTKKQKQHFVSWATNNIQLEDFLDDKRLRCLVYLHGKEFCIDKLLLSLAAHQTEIANLHERIQMILDMIIPIYSIRGKDIIAQGIPANNQIGILLDKLEQLWIESDFSLSREEMLEIAKTMHSQCA